jgi:hypothetical protein
MHGQLMIKNIEYKSATQQKPDIDHKARLIKTLQPINLYAQ